MVSGRIKLLIILFLLFFMSNCRNSVKHTIISTLEETCPKISGQCIFSLSDLTRFTWDTLVIVDDGMPSIKVDSVFGTDSGIMAMSDAYQMVFMNKGSIVKHEYFRLGELQFRAIDWKKDWASGGYNPESSVFVAVKRFSNTSERYYWDLYPLSGTLTPPAIGNIAD